ncbi:MAG: hypothetical protein JWQ71_2086 [Pedosphaera sp.]|nr:hypothetical protein [Pedosphaera sp.]
MFPVNLGDAVENGGKQFVSVDLVVEGIDEGLDVVLSGDVSLVRLHIPEKNSTAEPKKERLFS